MLHYTPGGTGFKVVLSPLLGSAGDADLFLSDSWNTAPSMFAANVSSMTDGTEVVHVPEAWCATPPPCDFYIGVLAYYNASATYRLSASRGPAPVPLSEGIPVDGLVSVGGLDPYSTAVFLASSFDAFNVALTTLSGDPDLYILIGDVVSACGGGGGRGGGWGGGVGVGRWRDERGEVPGPLWCGLRRAAQRRRLQRR